MSRKVVYNGSHSYFRLSSQALAALRSLGVCVMHEYDEVVRHDPRLVAVVETLGNRAGSDLRVHRLRGDRYFIDENDGKETVVEPDDIEWVIAR